MFDTVRKGDPSRSFCNTTSTALCNVMKWQNKSGSLLLLKSSSIKLVIHALIRQ